MIEIICDFCGSKREMRKGGHFSYFNEEESKEAKSFDLCMSCCRKILELKNGNNNKSAMPEL